MFPFEDELNEALDESYDEVIDGDVSIEADCGDILGFLDEFGGD